MNITIQTSSPEGSRLFSVLSKERGYRVFCTTQPLTDQVAEETMNRSDLFIIESGDSVSHGLNQVKALRRQFEKAIFLLGPSDDELERIVALEVGADEYIPTTCHHREIVARIRNIARWIRKVDTPESNIHYPAGLGWFLNKNRRCLQSKLGGFCSLSHKEFILLDLLFENINNTVEREDILKNVYKREWSPSDRIVDILIGKIRKKIEKISPGDKSIRTVYGVGYMLMCDC